MTIFVVLIFLASAAGNGYAVALRQRAMTYRIAPEDLPASSHAELAPEGQVLLARAQRWSRVWEAINLLLVGGIVLVSIVEATGGQASWGMPIGGGMVLAGLLMFNDEDLMSSTQRAYRGFAAEMGYTLRPVRNRVAASLTALGIVIAFISGG